MNTDKITQHLYDQAIDCEKKKLKDAALYYNKAIGLSGTNAKVTLKNKEGVTIELLTSEIYDAITNSLLEQRDKRLKTNAVNDFLNKFSAFSDYMRQMEEYGEQQ